MEILTHPNPALRQHAVEFDPTTERGLRGLVRDMARIMYATNGVGIAGPQVGVLKRLIVFDVEDELAALCDPVIVQRSEETVIEEEGCLSVPGIDVPVERSVSVVCTGRSIDGKPVTISADGLMARMLQHETDHLDGILMIDHLAPADLKKAMREYNAVRTAARGE